MLTRRLRHRFQLTRRNGVSRSGTAATEFALALPVLIIIGLGTVDLGRGVHHRITLSNAVREGAMYGATTGFTDYTHPSWEAEVREHVIEELSSNSGFQPADLTVDVNTAKTNDDQIVLTVRGNYPFETIIPWPGVSQKLEFSHQVEMRRYR